MGSQDMAMRLNAVTERTDGRGDGTGCEEMRKEKYLDVWFYLVSNLPFSYYINMSTRYCDAGKCCYRTKTRTDVQRDGAGCEGVRKEFRGPN